MSRLCVIKVSDLLRNATYADEVAIEDCMIAIPHLRAPGVSAVCRLQSTNDGMIVATLSDIVAQIDDICDLSGESYIRSVYIDSYQWKFNADVAFHADPNYVYEDDFPFLPDGESIDIEDMLVQAIVLQEPLIHIKPGNEHIIDDIYEDQEEYTAWTVSFRTAS